MAALLVALAAAAEPFVTTAAASAALKTQLSQLTPLATGLQIRDELDTYDLSRQAEALPQARKREASVERLAKSLPFAGRLDVADLSPQRGDTDRQGGILVTTPGGTAAVRLVARAGSVAHVKILTQTSGPGVWIDEVTAKALNVKPGKSIRLGGEPGLRGVATGAAVLRVKGIYRPLSYQTQTPYWVNFYQDIYPQSLDASPPPAFVLMSRPTFFGTLAKLGGGDFDEVFQLPVDPSGLTLQDARGLVRRFAAVNHTIAGTRSGLGRSLDCRPQELPSPRSLMGLPASCMAVSSLSAAVTLADQNVSAISPAITLLSDAGIAIALAVAASAGIFLVRRRRAEAALLFARGESMTTFGARTTTEALLPTLVGGAAGFGLALGLTGVFAPHGSTNQGTLESALAHAGIAVVAGLALLTITAASAFLRLFDTGSRPLPSWLRFLLWEVPLLAIAFWLLYQVHSGGGLAGSGTSGTRHPTLEVFIFPLLLVAGAAGLAARLVRRLLRSGSGRRSHALPAALYLAVRRLAAARGVLVTLVVVSSVAFGAFFYAETLAASLSKTTNEKAYIATGSDVSGQTLAGTPLPRSFPVPDHRASVLERRWRARQLVRDSDGRDDGRPGQPPADAALEQRLGAEPGDLLTRARSLAVGPTAGDRHDRHSARHEGDLDPGHALPGPDPGACEGVPRDERRESRS